MNILNRGYWVVDRPVGRGTRLRDQRDDEHRHRRPAPTASRPGSGSSPAASSASPRASSSSTSRSTTPPARWRPVKEIAEASQDRPGDEHHLGHRGRLRDHLRRPPSPSASRSWPATGSARRRAWSTPNGDNVGGIFGTAVATMGMLMTTAYILAMDTFGPITDNAGGIAEFSQAPRPVPARSPTASTRSATRPRR